MSDKIDLSMFDKPDNGDQAIDLSMFDKPAEDSWGDVIKKSGQNAWTSTKRAATGLLQGQVADTANSVEKPAIMLEMSDKLEAAKSGVESAVAWFAERGINPNAIKNSDDLSAAADKVVDAQLTKANTLGYSDAKKKGAEYSKELQDNQVAADKWSAKGIVGAGGQALAEMSGAAIATLITKNPAIGAAIMGTQVYGNSYQDGIEKGLSSSEAHNRALKKAVIEGGSEAIPLGAIAKPGKTFIGGIGKSAAAEGIQEGASNAVSDIDDNLFHGDNKSMKDIAEDALYGAIVGAGVGGVMHGTLQAPGKVQEAVKAKLESEVAPQANADTTVAAQVDAAQATSAPQANVDTTVAPQTDANIDMSMFTPVNPDAEYAPVAETVRNAVAEQGDALDVLSNDLTIDGRKEAYAESRHAGDTTTAAVNKSMIGDALDVAVFKSGKLGHGLRKSTTDVNTQREVVAPEVDPAPVHQRTEVDTVSRSVAPEAIDLSPVMPQANVASIEPQVDVAPAAIAPRADIAPQVDVAPAQVAEAAPLVTEAAPQVVVRAPQITEREVQELSDATIQAEEAHAEVDTVLNDVITNQVKKLNVKPQQIRATFDTLHASYPNNPAYAPLTATTRSEMRKEIDTRLAASKANVDNRVAQRDAAITAFRSQSIDLSPVMPQVDVAPTASAPQVDVAPTASAPQVTAVSAPQVDVAPAAIAPRADIAPQVEVKVPQVVEREAIEAERKALVADAEIKAAREELQALKDKAAADELSSLRKEIEDLKAAMTTQREAAPQVTEAAPQVTEAAPQVTEAAPEVDHTELNQLREMLEDTKRTLKEVRELASKSGRVLSARTRAKMIDEVAAMREAADVRKREDVKTEEKPLTDMEVAEIAVDFLKEFKGTQAVPMTVVPSEAGLFENMSEDHVVLGFYDIENVSATLISNNLYSREEVEALLRHEMIVHYGLRARLNREAYDAEMDKILAARKSPALARYFRQVEENYEGYYDLTTDAGNRMMAEEVMALVAENPAVLEKSGVIKRAIEAIRQMLIKAGILKDNASLESVRQLIKANADYLSGNNVDRGDVRVSFAPMQINLPEDAPKAMSRRQTIEDASVPEAQKEILRRINGIESKPSILEALRNWWNEFQIKEGFHTLYGKVIDDSHSLTRLERESNDGKLKAGRESAVKALQNSRGMESIMAEVVNGNALKYENGAWVPDREVGGILHVFKPVSELPGNYLEHWATWAGAKRAAVLIKEGRENLYTQADIDTVLAYVEARPELKKAYEETHSRWQKLNKANLDFQVATGLLSQEQVDAFSDDTYVPFNRMVEDSGMTLGGDLTKGGRGLSGQTAGIKLLKGGTAKLDIVNSMINNTLHAYEAGIKNATLGKILDVAEGVAMERVNVQNVDVRISGDKMKNVLNDAGIATSGMTSEQLKASYDMVATQRPEGDNIISYKNNGKTQYYRVEDPALLQAIAGLPNAFVKKVAKVGSWPKKVLTTLVTLNPTFVARNFIRDMGQTFVVAPKETGRTVLKDVATLRPLWSTVRGIVRAAHNSEVRSDFRATGGLSGVAAGEISAVNAAGDIKKALGYRSRMERVARKHMTFDIDNYKRVMYVAENAQRMEVYKDVMDTTGDPMEATYQANDLFNYTRRGSSNIVTILNAFMPFLNARIQGTDKLVRAVKDNPKGVAVRGAIYVALSLALRAYNADDEEYMTIPEEIRDANWTFKIGGQRFFIPKPFEVGTFFATIPEIIFDEITRGDETNTTNRLGRIAGNTFALDPVNGNAAFGPMMQDWLNRDALSGNPIVPRNLENAPLHLQYTSRTPAIFRSMAKAMPEWMPDMFRSPVRLEHLMNGYLGGAPRLATDLGEEPMREALGYDDTIVGQTIADMPVFRAFMGKPVQYSQYTGKTYEMIHVAERLEKERKALVEAGDGKALMDFSKKNRKKLLALPAMKVAKKELSSINKEMNAIRDNKVMKPEMKRKRIDLLSEKRNAVGKKYMRFFETFSDDI